MKINFLKLLKRKDSFQNYFPESEFQFLDTEGTIYPCFISMKRKGVFAYSTRFMVKPDDLPKVEGLVEQCFYKSSLQENESLSDHDKKLLYFRFVDFNCIAIDIITNDNNFIAKLGNLKLEPPLPDAVFPHVELDSYGSLQGDLAFWWDLYWEPFWKTLPERERAKYIEKNNLSHKVISFLMQH